MGILVRRVGAVLTAVLALAFWHSAAWADFSWNFPEPVTPIAEETLKVHNLFMLIITVVFVTVFAIMLYSFYTHRKSVGHKAADFTQPNSRKQWFWVIVPFAVLLFIDYIVFGIPAYHAIHMYEDSKTDAEMVVKVTGSQWKWQYEYPDEGIKFVSVLTTPREQVMNQAPKEENYLLEVDNPLVLPIHKKVRFITTSTDVIHSWWVPAFGVKRDAVPGFLREFWATIEKPGIYRGQCAELCGKDHAFMPVVVHAVSQSDYDAWVATKQAEQVAAAASAQETWSRDRLMALGQEVYGRACAVCHQPEGQGLPPVFPALAGSAMATAPFVDGNGNLIKDGHLDRVMNGKAGTAMQAFKATLNDAEIAAVVTYERNAFGNAANDEVQPSLVSRLREAGQ
ncbi:MAG: cytochrome c oxidase subunit II [Chromatiales bacterium]|jgi:cytochrome c oxidase subunit 2|nr:cytochrome c oxidase subunit II [Chromatiales bacterium]MDX9767262.1 cytochrome c oxidase subunit II [Ectothiorhodospiraceae bacterium]